MKRLQELFLDPFRIVGEMFLTPGGRGMADPMLAGPAMYMDTPFSG